MRFVIGKGSGTVCVCVCVCVLLSGVIEISLCIELLDQLPCVAPASW